MSYEYMKSEACLWTVGSYASGKWESESDHGSSDTAAARVHYLNGGDPAYDELVLQLMACVGKLESVARDINSSAPDTSAAMRTTALHGRNALAEIGYVLT